MIKSEFRKIAESENGKFYYHDEDISIGMGVRSPNVIFILDLSYKECPIKIKNTTGTAYYGLITSKILTNNKPLEFELTTRSHLSTLFWRKNDRFKIETDYTTLNQFLKNSTSLSKLNQIAKKTKFHPLIKGEFQSDGYKLTTKYHLEFSDWTQVLVPLINFYKEFIDKFQERNANNAYNSSLNQK